jgi:hypothetical protein
MKLVRDYSHPFYSTAWNRRSLAGEQARQRTPSLNAFWRQDPVHVKSLDEEWKKPMPIRDTSFRTDRKIDFTFNEKPEVLPDRSIKFKRSYDKD